MFYALMDKLRHAVIGEFTIPEAEEVQTAFFLDIREGGYYEILSGTVWSVNDLDNRLSAYILIDKPAYFSHDGIHWVTAYYKGLDIDTENETVLFIGDTRSSKHQICGFRGAYPHIRSLRRRVE